MILHVREVLAAPGERFPFELESHPSALDVGEETLVFTQPVRITGEMAAYGDRIHLSGRLQTSLRGACARCLEPAAVNVALKISEMFSKTEDEEQPDNRLYDGMVIDLSDMAEELIRLELPIRLLCRDNCAGLCPACGKNRNDTPCGCFVPEDDEEDEVARKGPEPPEAMVRSLSGLGDMLKKHGDRKSH